MVEFVYYHHDHMSIRRYLVTMVVATIVSAASWFLVVAFLDPQSSGFLGISLFFFSFFLAIFGMSSIIGYGVRRFCQRYETQFRIVAISFRQATLIAVLLTASLILQSYRLFTWWTAILLLVFLSLVEAFFVARDAVRPGQQGVRHGA